MKALLLASSIVISSIPGCTPQQFKAAEDFIEGEEKVIEQVIYDESGVAVGGSQSNPKQ